MYLHLKSGGSAYLTLESSEKSKLISKLLHKALAGCVSFGKYVAIKICNQRKVFLYPINAIYRQLYIENRDEVMCK